MSSIFNRSKTPRPNKRSPTPSGSLSRKNSMTDTTGDGSSKPLYLCSPFADAALVSGNFKTIVTLPKYTDIMEWVAVNIFDFYTNLNEFYAVLLDYVWGSEFKLHVDNAREETDIYGCSYVYRFGQEFNPQTFPVTVKHIYRQFLRIFAHIYHAHFETILHLRAEPHFNSLFAHFLAFGREYQLLEERDIKGEPSAPVGVGLLWERWKESGKLEH
ncbi:hypothetical protein D9758_015174 [Tetrapyrgos nigripes]|uniref:Maintenance of ploidy protein mob2 n=1 Tax=Tetrapyrgos nigripes TaxID=182062 RepID=A0A8H5C0Q6_9AGAR|nr:hypothetical protein D9758_015174 [Tetrapyrgos nigripes]